MNLKRKLIFLSLMLLVLLAALSGCGAETSPYDRNDADGYRISVRYDANGGYFTTNTSVIVDSYDPAALPQQGGRASIALLAPDNSARGNDAFAPIHNGYFLAGWYAERTETENGYIYGKKWDFEKDRLEVDVNGIYTSAEPVLTLYAAWVPLFRVEFYDTAGGDPVGSYSFDPTGGKELQLPHWNTETGAMEMYRFPVKQGHTYETVSYEPGEAPITGQTLTHPGTLDETTGTASDVTLKLYIDYREGEWYRISTVEQFLENASVTGSYEILADLDFADAIWPTSLMYGNYSGTVNGNGHSFKNIQLRQTNNAKANAGLFGALTDSAKIRDLTLENVTFTIEAGTRVTGTSYGLFAGSISGGAEISNVSIQSSLLQVDSNCYFGTDEYVIGLICGSGTTDIDPSGIATAAVGDAPEKVNIKVEGQTVTVEIALD